MRLRYGSLNWNVAVNGDGPPLKVVVVVVPVLKLVVPEELSVVPPLVEDDRSVLPEEKLVEVVPLVKLVEPLVAVVPKVAVVSAVVKVEVETGWLKVGSVSATLVSVTVGS